jgi:hypothetical protein
VKLCEERVARRGSFSKANHPGDDNESQRRTNKQRDVGSPARQRDRDLDRRDAAQNREHDEKADDAAGLRFTAR